MTDTLFPIETTPAPELERARRELERLQAEYERMLTAEDRTENRVLLARSVALMAAAHVRRLESAAMAKGAR